MLFGIDINNFIMAITSIVGIVLAIEKTYKWAKEKFYYAHNKVNETNTIKETLNQDAEEIKSIKEQNQLIIEGIKNLLKDKLKREYVEYKHKSSITTEELEEYESTYTIYAAMGGNGVGKRYYEEVMELEVIDS